MTWTRTTWTHIRTCRIANRAGTGRIRSLAQERTFRPPASVFTLYAYLRSRENPNDPLSRTSAGVLLYPSLGVDYDEAATIKGHRIRFVTVDLAAETQTIRRQLLRIVEG